MRGLVVAHWKFLLRFIAAASFVAVAACTNQAGGDSVTVEQRKAIALRFAEELWGRGNLQIIDELCTPDFFWGAAIGEPMGIEAIKEYVAWSRREFPDQETLNNITIGEGDWVANRWIVRATHAATGKILTYWGNVMLRFEGDKIAEEWGVHTLSGAMQRAGIPVQPERD